jgi:hypothetical protein
MSFKNPTAQEKQDIDKALKDLDGLSNKAPNNRDQQALLDAYDSVRILLKWITG